MILRKPKDFFSGLMFIALGAATLLPLRNLSFGTARSMGPSFFPTLLASALIVLGVIVFLRSFFGSQQLLGPPSLIAIRSVLGILGASVVFGLSVRPMGLLIAVILTVIVGSFAMRGYGMVRAIVIGTVLAASCSIVFVVALGLPMPIVAWPLGF